MCIFLFPYFFFRCDFLCFFFSMRFFFSYAPFLSLCAFSFTYELFMTFIVTYFFFLVYVYTFFFIFLRVVFTKRMRAFWVWFFRDISNSFSSYLSFVCILNVFSFLFSLGTARLVLVSSLPFLLFTTLLLTTPSSLSAFLPLPLYVCVRLLAYLSVCVSYTILDDIILFLSLLSFHYFERFSYSYFYVFSSILSARSCSCLCLISVCLS
ncbi:hypothetical protein CPC08DRAFT_218730 [Agrocybe pediades]|nr:hypothetical protein CPC08DRAFT_218730 [Agrocybe pediades]